MIRVTGADATAWLHDLVTADIASLAPGRARRSLLLTPTGRIRADVTVVRDEEGSSCSQEPAQPDRIEALLDPYVLSSDVALGDVTDETGRVLVARGRAGHRRHDLHSRRGRAGDRRPRDA